MRAHIFRTHDSGASWSEVVRGLENAGPVNVVREDPRRAGLLFAGTERAVYFSIDDGANWQSLRMNMPASSIRDLVIHENDLVVGTHGRSIWILDGMTPLREIAAAPSAGTPYLFAPGPATRVRWNMFLDTPLPPEEPAGENPPDGAILDYYLKESASRVTLEVLDGDEVVRKFSSDDAPERLESGLMVASDLLVSDRSRSSRPSLAITVSSGICGIPLLRERAGSSPSPPFIARRRPLPRAHT